MAYGFIALLIFILTKIYLHIIIMCKLWMQWQTNKLVDLKIIYKINR
jgi:hypothetical protein